jgi:hypothetical protein
MTNVELIGIRARANDPLRYFIHPVIIGLMGDTSEAKALRHPLRSIPALNTTTPRYSLVKKTSQSNNQVTMHANGNGT